ncbi:putative potassium channel protein [Vibrio ponticus]|nr:putative potassium channel protein [Vibrio ponticus]
MALWLYLKRKLHATLFDLSGRNLLLLSVAYIVIAWLLLKLAGETALTNSFSNFVYYLMVTASTVGYGDHSPVTDAGKWSWCCL